MTQTVHISTAMMVCHTKKPFRLKMSPRARIVAIQPTVECKLDNVYSLSNVDLTIGESQCPAFGLHVS